MSNLDDLSALLSGLYVCRRNWAAWEVGTMSADDFARASDDADTVDEAMGLLAVLRAKRDTLRAERDAALAERDRLRTLIAEAADDLPLHPEGAHLTQPEADAEYVRQALLAALRGEA
jgi:hypothetical protein